MAGSYKLLDHMTDAIVETRGANMTEALIAAGDAIINISLDKTKVVEKETREFTASGKDMHYLLFNWLEEVPFVLITEGFAISRLELTLSKNADGFKIDAIAHGEELDINRHGWKVEIKAPTFYDMVIDENADGVYMRFLLDL